MAYVIVYYNASVQGSIDEWPAGIGASYMRILEQMVVTGPNLGLPYTRALGDGLFEIRAKGKEGIGRVFFGTQVGQRILILHGYIKKTQRTPQKELKIARKRLKEVLNEQNN